MVSGAQVMAAVISLIIVVGVGLAFTGEQVDTLTTLQSVTNESFNSSVPNTVVNAANEPFSGTPTIFGNINGTGNIMDAATGMGIILQNGNYTLDTNDATINFSNGKYNNSLYNISYDFEPDNFISDSKTVTILNLFVLFFAIAALFVIGKGVDLF